MSEVSETTFSGQGIENYLELLVLYQSNQSSMSGKKTNKDWWSNMVDILPETCQVFVINRCIIYSACCHTKSHTVLVGSQSVLQEVLLCQLSSMVPCGVGVVSMSFAGPSALAAHFLLI